MVNRTAIQPVGEPIGLVAVKLHLRVDHTDDDVLIADLIKSARDFVEDFTARRLIVRTEELTINCFPSPIAYGKCGIPFTNSIELPSAPLISVSSVKYYDTAGVEQTLAASVYTVDAKSEPGRIYLAYGQWWPAAQNIPNAVRITYLAGYVATFSAAVDDTITMYGLTLANGDIVRVVNSGGALPAGLSADTTYYVISASGSTCKLSLTLGGAAVDVTGTGTGTHYIGFDMMPPGIISAMLLLIGHWYENREALSADSLKEVPMAVKDLLWQKRLMRE